MPFIVGKQHITPALFYQVKKEKTILSQDFLT